MPEADSGTAKTAFVLASFFQRHLIYLGGPMEKNPGHDVRHAPGQAHRFVTQLETLCEIDTANFKGLVPRDIIASFNR